MGGTNPQENNVIAGNLGQGVVLDTAATGDVVEGNQIGMIGPAGNGRYFQVGNGLQGVLDEGSSNIIGGSADRAGNVISGNGLDGVEILGPGATETTVGGNLIGLAPGGGYVFGTGDPGNDGNGVLIVNSAANVIGGPDSSWANIISSNSGDGVLVTGASSTGNTILNDLIGLTASGSAVKGNLQDGVGIGAAQNTIGPGNVISGNLRGIIVFGADTIGTLIEGNLIGTDITGELDLGNATEGVLIQNATEYDHRRKRPGLAGDLRQPAGIVITGATASQNLIVGNLIGTDKTGLHALPNAQEGVPILSAPGNTIGGTTPAARNLISANHWGVRIDGASRRQNLVEGNLIGTDITGKAPLGNEINGVMITTKASNNTIGGTVAGAGNTIAFNALQACPWCREPVIRSSPTASIPTAISESSWCAPTPPVHSRTEQPSELSGPHLGRLQRPDHPRGGNAQQPAQYHVPDPVLRQSRGRSVRLRPGTDRVRLDAGHDRHLRQRHVRPSDRSRLSRRRSALGDGDEPDHRRYVGVRQGHRPVIGVSVHRGAFT